MCGFVGILSVDQQPIELPILKNMANRQRHRGPDDQHFFVSSNPSMSIGLGFNRLSIIDLSHAGRQPMLTEDQQVALVFNGELYNAVEWREYLSGKGYGFRGRSDTEVLLNLYLEFGIRGLFERANGMMALAIVDFRLGKLFLGRDRLGIKPLYWARVSSGLLFSSEVKSFLGHPDFKAELNEQYLSEYFMFRYTAQERFLLKNVEQVVPGEYLEISSQGHLRRYSYWTMPQPSEDMDPDLAVQKCGSILEESVSRQLVSDVAVGCQLSGGLDSSMISWFASQKSENIQGFSIDVQDSKFSEKQWIDEASARIGLRVHQFPMGEKEFAERFEQSSWHLDQPLNHMNSIGIYLLAERSKPFVKVLLSGEGADELFGGYGRFYRVLLRRYLAPLAPLLGGKFAAFSSDRGENDAEWFVLAASPMSRKLLEESYPSAGWNEAIQARVSLFGNHRDFGAEARNYELKTYLVDLLVRQDKMTMAHSIENRVPFLDNEVLDFVCSLPSYHCVRPLRYNSSKLVLKKLASDVFSQRFVYRKKEGFGVPLGRFLASWHMRDKVEQLLVSIQKRGLVNAVALRRWYQHELNNPLVAEALWIHLALEQFLVQFVDVL